MRKVEVNNELFLDSVALLVARGQKVTITVKGDSMYPFLKEGQLVQLIPKPGKLSKMDLILAKVEGRYILHRLIKLEGDKVTMMGDGNLYNCEYCSVADVVAVVNRGVNDVRYANLWLKLLPIRRYLIFLMRKVL